MKLIVKQATRVQGCVHINGDKSITHRAFIFASLAKGPSVIYRHSDCTDCMSTLTIMEKLGAVIKRGRSYITITGSGLHGLAEPADVLDCGNSGTTMRLLAGVLAGQPFHAILTGDESLRKRPMARIVQPLSNMGADIRGREKGKFAPLSITGTRLCRINYELPVASAQVKSCLILAGLYGREESVIYEPRPTRDHTERILSFFGGYCQKKGNRLYIRPVKELIGHDIIVPGDISSAAYFIVLGTLAPQADIRLNKIGLNPSRTGILEVLEQMNARLQIGHKQEVSGEPYGNIAVTGSRLQGIHINGNIIPRLIDEIPIISVAATQAEGMTEIRDAGELRVKETDRIASITMELNKMGAHIVEHEDGLSITGPSRLTGTVVDSHGDHRIAMSLAIAGLIADGETIIQNAECIAISFPDFIENLKRVCVEKDVNIED